MIAHLSPEEDSFGETISTLKFAQRVSSVELGAAYAHKETKTVLSHLWLLVVHKYGVWRV